MNYPGHGDTDIPQAKNNIPGVNWEHGRAEWKERSSLTLPPVHCVTTHPSVGQRQLLARSAEIQKKESGERGW